MDEETLFYQFIGQELRKCRNSAGKTLEDIADDIQMDDKHIGKVENAKKRPLLYTFYKLIHTYDVSSDEIFDRFQNYIKKGE